MLQAYILCNVQCKTQPIKNTNPNFEWFRYYTLTGYMIFSSDFGQHIYTIPLIPLSCRPYFSDIYHCIALHIIIYLHISFYYIHCFPSHPAQHMPSSIISSSDHSIYTKKSTCISVSLVSYEHGSSSYSIPCEPLTRRQPPLTIRRPSLPHLHFHYFSFMRWLFTCKHCCSLSFIQKPLFHNLLPYSFFFLNKSFHPHISGLLHSKHTNIQKPLQIHQLPQTKLLTYMIASFSPTRLI